MDLFAYLSARKLSYSEGAKLIGISRSALSNYLNGRRKPSLSVAQKIEEFSKGKVKIKDLMEFCKEKNDE